MRLWAWGLLALGIVTVLQAGYWQPASGKWQKLTDCQFVENPADDGDSFYVRHGKDTFLFRLYSVDTPETSMNYPDRVADQAKHFGITNEQAVKAGLEAERFTNRLLSGQNLTIDTCWQDAKGNSRVPRYYVVVTVNGKDLAEQLAATGLARVYGFTPAIPGFSLPRLENLERQAKSQKIGAYGDLKKGAAIAANDPNASRLFPTVSSFKPVATATPAALPAAARGKVNVNTATREELEAVPGIGSTFAAALIAGRPYASLDGIRRIPGITQEALAQAVPYLTVSGP